MRKVLPIIMIFFASERAHSFAGFTQGSTIEYYCGWCEINNSIYARCTDQKNNTNDFMLEDWKVNCDATPIVYSLENNVLSCGQFQAKLIDKTKPVDEYHGCPPGCEVSDTKSKVCNPPKGAPYTPSTSSTGITFFNNSDIEGGIVFKVIGSIPGWSSSLDFPVDAKLHDIFDLSNMIDSLHKQATKDNRGTISIVANGVSCPPIIITPETDTSKLNAITVEFFGPDKKCILRGYDNKSS